MVLFILNGDLEKYQGKKELTEQFLQYNSATSIAKHLSSR